jgi:hypothetical protein
VFRRRQASQTGCIELPSKTVKGRSEMQHSFKLGMPSIVEKCRHRGVVQKRGFVRIGFLFILLEVKSCCLYTWLL